MITRVEIGAISLNDNPNYWLSGVSGLEMPQTRLASYNLAGEHFGYLVSVFYGKRRFGIEGTIIGESVSDFIAKRDAFQNALTIMNGEQAVVFTLANGRIVQIAAVLVTLDAPLQEGFVNAGRFHAEFEAAFPFLVGQSETVQTIVLATGGGGSVPPPTMPMGLAADAGGRAYVLNNGNGIYYPTARIAGPVTNPALRNNATGKELRFSLTLLAGEYLDVDFKRKTVTDQTGRNRYDTKTGDWWSLTPGVSEVRFVADSTDPLSSVTFRSRDSYLGL